MKRFKSSEANKLLKDKTENIYNKIVSQIKDKAKHQNHTHVYIHIPSEVEIMLVNDGYKLSNINQYDQREGGYLTLIKW